MICQSYIYSEETNNLTIGIKTKKNPIFNIKNKKYNIWLNISIIMKEKNTFEIHFIYYSNYTNAML